MAYFHLIIPETWKICLKGDQEQRKVFYGPCSSKDLFWSTPGPDFLALKNAKTMMGFHPSALVLNSASTQSCAFGENLGPSPISVSPSLCIWFQIFYLCPTRPGPRSLGSSLSRKDLSSLGLWLCSFFLYLSLLREWHNDQCHLLLSSHLAWPPISAHGLFQEYIYLKFCLKTLRLALYGKISWGDLGQRI